MSSDLERIEKLEAAVIDLRAELKAVKESNVKLERHIRNIENHIGINRMVTRSGGSVNVPDMSKGIRK
jgi:cell division protein FtsB